MVTENDIWQIMSETLDVSMRPAQSEKFANWPKGVHKHSILYITGLDDCVTKMTQMVVAKGKA